MNSVSFESCIRSGVRCHLVGIGGVSMSPLAELLHGLGVNVTGSDMNDSPSVRKLIAKGIPVTVGHSADNVRGAGYIIRTAAAREDNAEIKAARELGLPVFERAQAWGYIMQGYKNAVCVAGVHGKTTTTSMLTSILLAAGADPTFMIGGVLPTLGTGYQVGRGDTIVLESCEYYNSFHSFFPTVAVILNIDADHLDFFRDIDDIKDSFRKFAALVPNGGYIVCNGDDKNTMDTLSELERDLFTFGLEVGVRVRGVNVSASGRGPTMNVLFDDEPFCKIKLKVPGVHNLKNALAAAAVAITLGIPAKTVEEGLYAFTGVGRRFEYKGSFNGADVYDDYAHHPSELHALLDAAGNLGYGRVILAFQPHTFSRTRALFSDFVTELSRADITFLAEIYAAREKNDIGISSGDLADAIPNARYYPTFDELVSEISAVAGEGDIIITVGAGDIYKVGETIAAQAKKVNV